MQRAVQCAHCGEEVCSEECATTPTRFEPLDVDDGLDLRILLCLVLEAGFLLSTMVAVSPGSQ